MIPMFPTGAGARSRAPSGRFLRRKTLPFSGYAGSGGRTLFRNGPEKVFRPCLPLPQPPVAAIRGRRLPALPDPAARRPIREISGPNLVEFVQRFTGTLTFNFPSCSR